MQKLIPDMYTLLDGYISRKIGQGELTPEVIIIHQSILDEIETTSKYPALNEIKRLSDHCKLIFIQKGTIRDIAYNESATLITSSKKERLIAKARGINVILIPTSFDIPRYFDEETMSVHLKEGCLPLAKKGKPGDVNYEKIGDEMITAEMIMKLARQAREKSGEDGNIMQAGEYRVVSTMPPISAGWEMTIVKHLKDISLDDYNLSDDLIKRLDNAEGILIAGAPGMGKSTFAQSLAISYHEHKSVKTIESPMGLRLPKGITQLNLSKATHDEIKDILLLSRPDIVIFDEVRNIDDFRLFCDLRLSGTGLTGVVHATQAIDAIQRFVGKAELGMIPHIIDTVIFIKDGTVSDVLKLSMVMKVPVGMKDLDLTRPVVVVNDFVTAKPRYELFSFGNETVVVPIIEPDPDNLKQRVEILKRHLEGLDYDSFDVLDETSAIIYMDDFRISNDDLNQLQDRTGMMIKVKRIPHERVQKERRLDYDVSVSGNSIVFDLGIPESNVDILIEDSYLLSAKSGKNCMIKVKIDSDIGTKLVDAIKNRKHIKIFS